MQLTCLHPSHLLVSSHFSLTLSACPHPLSDSVAEPVLWVLPIQNKITHFMPLPQLPEGSVVMTLKTMFDVV